MSPIRDDAPDARVERTHAALVGAMSELLREGGAKPITVSDLCRRAGVSRPTFYGHFRTPDDVLSAAIQARVARLSDGAAPAAPAEIFSVLLDELAGDREVYGPALAGDGAYGHSRRTVEAWMAGRIGERLASAAAGDATAVERRRRTEFAAAGVMGAVATWLRESDPDDEAPVALARDLERLVLAVLGTPGDGRGRGDS
jgi:AcrR family transcriptional regulator